MQFIRGNLALRYHKENGKRVFLFTEDERSHVRVEAELEYMEFEFGQNEDKSDKKRTIIDFFFKKIGRYLSYDPEPASLSIVAEGNEAGSTDIPNRAERQGLVISRVCQGAYRKSILHRWMFRCAVTNYNKIEILIASHIVLWKHSSDDERLDVNNGILLSPVYDALFDQHLISFENNGKIIFSNTLAKTNYKGLGITGKEIIKKLSRENHSYLERHRLVLL